MTDRLVTGSPYSTMRTIVMATPGSPLALAETAARRRVFETIMRPHSMHGGYSGTKPAQETCFVGEARPDVGYLRRRRSCSSHPPDTTQACAWCLSNSRLLFARCTCRPNLRVLQAMVRPLCTVARTVVEGVARQLGSRDWSCNRWGCGKGGGTWRHLPASDG